MPIHMLRFRDKDGYTARCGAVVTSKSSKGPGMTVWEQDVTCPDCKLPPASG